MPTNSKSITHRTLSKSNAQFKKAQTRLPLGVASNFRYWGDDKTLYIKKGKGGRIWDIDDNQYIDYRLGYGPAILGYADERVDQAAREGMEVGGVFALATEREFTVAERMAKMVPSVDLVRFSNSGTEAVMAALRLARAYTGKDSYILIEGGYHGLFDAAMWYTDMEGWDEEKGEPDLKAYGEGIPKHLKRLAHTTPLNDADYLESILKRHGDSIAAMLVEPIMGNCCGIAAQPEYLKAVRQLCDKYGVVMIVDEVKTGFRVAKGGVQELYGVNADLCTFAKAMGNGYPISALAGKEEIMRKIGDGVAHGGTYTAHSVSLAACEKTLEILDETPALATIETYGKQVRDGMSKVLSKRGIAHSFTGHPSMLGLFFSEQAPSNYRDWRDSDYSFYDAMAQHLHDGGVLCEPDSREPWFMCEAHAKDKSLEQTLEAFESAVDLTLEDLDRSAAKSAAQ